MDDVQPSHVLVLDDVAIYIPLLFNRVRRVGVYSYLWFIVRITKKVYYHQMNNRQCKRFFSSSKVKAFLSSPSPFIFRGEEWTRNSLKIDLGRWVFLKKKKIEMLVLKCIHFEKKDDLQISSCCSFSNSLMKIRCLFYDNFR